SPEFSDPSTQFIWDSPLLVAFVKLIGPHLIPQALAFLAISLLPMILGFSRNSRIAQAFTLATLFTPMPKLLLENIGSGDGVTALLGILLVTLDETWLLSIVTLA